MSTRHTRPRNPLTSAVETVEPPRAAQAGSASMQAAPSAEGPATEERIRMAAYFLAEQRGFCPGHELDDWLAAEAMLRTVYRQSSG